MKKILMVVLAIVMILPMIASCGAKKPAGDPVEVLNVQVIDYSAAYEEATQTGKIPAKGEGSVLYEGPVNAYVPAGEEMTLGHLLAGFAYDIDTTAYKDGNGQYVKFYDISNGNGFAWLLYVNGADAGLETPIQADSKIVISYEMIEAA